MPFTNRNFALLNTTHSTFPVRLPAGTEHAICLAKLHYPIVAQYNEQ